MRRWFSLSAIGFIAGTTLVLYGLIASPSSEDSGYSKLASTTTNETPISRTIPNSLNSATELLERRDPPSTQTSDEHYLAEACELLSRSVPATPWALLSSARPEKLDAIASEMASATNGALDGDTTRFEYIGKLFSSFDLTLVEQCELAERVHYYFGAKAGAYTYRMAVSRAAKVPDAISPLEAQKLFSMGRIYWDLADYDVGANLYSLLLGRIPRTGAAYQPEWVYSEMIDLQGDHKKAAEILKKFLSTEGSKLRPAEASKVTFKIAGYLRKSGQLAEAGDYYLISGSAESSFSRSGCLQMAIQAYAGAGLTEKANEVLQMLVSSQRVPADRVK